MTMFGGNPRRAAPLMLGDSEAAPFDYAPYMRQPTPTSAHPPRRGMFGGNGRAIAGLLGDAISRLSGGEAMYVPMMLQQRQQEQVAQQRRQEREQERADNWTDWQAREQWQLDHPAPRQPDAFDTAIRNAGIDPNSEQGRALYRQRADALANPLQYLPNGDGTFTVVPRGGTPPQGQPSGPQPGTEVGGFRFRGGNPNDRANWEPVGGQPAGNGPFDAGRLNAITARNESGNRDYDRNGQPVRSPRGALYAMQVLPSTARDPGFGLRPANPSDPADMNRLGRDYRAMLQRRYGGDPALMWAAYNAGPGRVDEARRRHGDNWLQHMPRETRNYVARNMRELRGR